MIIKGDLVLDVSYYESIQNWRDAGPRPKLIIARATYGERQDTSFSDHWRQCKELGIRRGAYHYLYAVPLERQQTPQDSIGKQAKNFIKRIREEGFTSHDSLWLDWEEYGNQKAPSGLKLQALMKQFIDHVERETGAVVGVYSRKDMLDKLAVLGIFPSWLQNRPIWLAWYPYSSVIDSIAEFPKNNIRLWPKWLKSENLALWQYSDKYIDPKLRDVEHLVNAIDINYIYPAYASQIGLNWEVPQSTDDIPTQPPGEITLPVADNCTYRKIKRFGAWCHVVEITGGHFQVTPFAYKTVAQVQKETLASVVINGGDHRGKYAIGWYAVNGRVYAKPNKDEMYAPVVNFSEANKVEIRESDRVGKLYNAIAGKRFLVKDGKKGQTSSAWSFRAARTLIGTKGSTTLLVVVEGEVEGKDGVTLHEGASIMLELGCERACDLDGGRSSQLTIGATSMYGKPEEVANHLVWYAR